MLGFFIFVKNKAQMNVLITGASSGIGNGLAQYYLENKHAVYAVNRRDCKNLEKYEHFHLLQLDLFEAEKNVNKICSFFKDAGRIDLAILNAGILSEVSDMKDISLDSIRMVMDINVWSNKVLIDSLLQICPSIKQIVAISSGASISGARGWNAYSISKASLNMLIKLYANENKSVHFCALAPGVIDTAMQDYLFSLSDILDFPTVKRLQQAKGNNELKSPEESAQILVSAFSKILEFESGSYQDVRKLEL